MEIIFSHFFVRFSDAFLGKQRNHSHITFYYINANFVNMAMAMTNLNSNSTQHHSYAVSSVQCLHVKRSRLNMIFSSALFFLQSKNACIMNIFLFFCFFALFLCCGTVYGAAPPNWSIHRQIVFIRYNCCYFFCFLFLWRNQRVWK